MLWFSRPVNKCVPLSRNQKAIASPSRVLWKALGPCPFFQQSSSPEPIILSPRYPYKDCLLGVITITSRNEGEPELSLCCSKGTKKEEIKTKIQTILEFRFFSFPQIFEVSGQTIAEKKEKEKNGHICSKFYS